MIRPKLVVVNTERDEQSRGIRDGKGSRFQLSRSRLIVYSLSLFVSLCFMFTLGIFVGRGMSVVRPNDFSLKGRFLRFLGLGRQTEAVVPHASVTWEDPRKMLESLHYYQDLTRQSRSPLGTLPQAATPSAAAARSARLAKEVKPAAAPGLPERHLTAQRPVKPLTAAAPMLPVRHLTAQRPVKPPAAAADSAGRYTLLVASLREHKARALVGKLKADGYSPLVESLEFGSTRWSRILLGSFPTRKAAIAFAEKFNRKEKTQALVISGSK